MLYRSSGRQFFSAKRASQGKSLVGPSFSRVTQRSTTALDCVLVLSCLKRRRLKIRQHLLFIQCVFVLRRFGDLARILGENGRLQEHEQTLGPSTT